MKGLVCLCEGFESLSEALPVSESLNAWCVRVKAWCVCVKGLVCLCEGLVCLSEGLGVFE